MTTPLFDPTEFVGHSGDDLHWKVECDVLSIVDWHCLAKMAADIVEPFSAVWGIPQGGLPFADALREFAVPGTDHWVLADDVWTTGGSVREYLGQFTTEQRDLCSVIVAFNRSDESLPHNMHAVWSVHPAVKP